MNRPRFDLVSQEFMRNPYPTLTRMRESGPLIRMKVPLIGNVWVATTYAATTAILRDNEMFGTDPRNAGRKYSAGLQWWMPKLIRSLTSNMLGKDEPDHRRLRGLVEAAFMRQSIDAMRSHIAALVDQQLDVLEQEASANGGCVDFVEHFARPFPLSVISELLGFPPSDRPKFLKWASSLTNVTSPLSFLTILRGLWNLNRYFEQQFERCRQEPRPGMISALVQAEQDGHKLSKPELMATAFLLLLAGHETTTHLLSGGVLTLLQHPEQKAALVSDWSLADSAVGEVLRYFCPVQMTKPRYAHRDLELFGQHLQRGEFCMPSLAAANVDPEQFPNPETFDIRRTPNNHVTFGTGIHVCLGSKLAWAEAEIAFQKLFTRFPNLELSVPASELHWRERIGMRAVTRLPLNLTPH